MESCSEILPVQDGVALPQDLVSLEAEVVLFSQIAHIEEFFVVLLEEAALGGGYMGVTKGYVTGIVKRGHHTMALLTYILQERMMLAMRQE